MKKKLLEYLKGKTPYFCVIFVTVFSISYYCTLKSIELNGILERVSTKEELKEYIIKGVVPQDEEEN